ncbi:MAG TPA: hypothetical protein VFS27_06230 [Blastocatellia bacterium]|jgi:hypothetical protein|nr:hypothetical protein [Blastocatellia bacterium]
MNQPIILKGIVASKFLDPNNEVILSLQTSSSYIPQAMDESGKYEFMPHFSVTLRAADLGDPPIGATVQITVELS